METDHETPTELLQRDFDRVVDGEATDAERRSLLLQLDHLADGWKRLATSFLEAQAWKQSLKSVPCANPLDPHGTTRSARRVNHSDRQPVRSVPVGDPRRFSFASLQPHLRSLALILLAGAFGWLLNDSMPRPGPEPRGIVNNNTSFRPDVDADRGPATPQSDLHFVGREPRVVGNLSWLLANTGREQVHLELPIVENAEIDAEWLLKQPSCISDDMRASLRLRGQEVDVERGLLETELDDGRRVVIPVERFRVRPAVPMFQ
jgi:hypothetical protein